MSTVLTNEVFICKNQLNLSVYMYIYIYILHRAYEK